MFCPRGPEGRPRSDFLWTENLPADVGARLARLDLAQLEVLGLLAEGHRAAVVAEHLNVPLRTVRALIRGILIAMEVRTQLEAVVLWHIHLRDTPRRPGISD